MFETVRKRARNSDKAIFSVHCHNDLGMAVASRWLASPAARQIECTVNGIGERAATLRSKKSSWRCVRAPTPLPYDIGVETTMLNRASKLVSAVTRSRCSANKAIVGRNACARESGIHR